MTEDSSILEIKTNEYNANTIILNSFQNTNRRCCGCRNIISIGEYLKCSKCKVCIYCSKNCQVNHWKLCHKKTCKKQLISPPKEEDCMFVGDEIGLDILYKYIIIKSGNPLNRIEFMASMIGIEEDFDLDYIHSLNGCLDKDSNEVNTKTYHNLIEKYNWKNDISRISVPGYSHDYNGINLFAYHDKESNINKELINNNSAAMILMQPDFFGNIVLCCSTPLDCNDSSPENEIPIKICKRDILSIVMLNNECSINNNVSDRIFFNNIMNEEALLFFKSKLNDNNTVNI
jgi:hypothetical protein